MFRFTALACLLLSASLASADTFVILPFFNTSKSANLDWVGESISESIREALASESVIVLDRDDRREAYKRLSMRPNAQLTKASILVLGEALDAEQVIYGSFDFTSSKDAAPKSRGSLRITAQILDLRKMKLGPEYMELGALEDLARLQTHLAWQTLQFMLPKSAPSEQEFLKTLPVIKLGALENY